MDAPGDVLLIGMASDMAGDVVAPLEAAGLRPQLGTVADVIGRPWSLIISAPAIRGLGSMELLAALRSTTPAPPLLLVARAAELPPADAGPLWIECLPWPFQPEELVGRVQQLLRRHGAAVSAGTSVPKRQSLAWTDEAQFLALATHERDELHARRRPGESFVAVLRLVELDQYRERLGPQPEARLWEQVSVLAGMDALADEAVALGSEGDFLLLLPGTTARETGRRLQSLSARLAKASLQLGGQAAQFSPAIGFQGLRRSASAAAALAEARQACGQSVRHLDLHPVRWRRAASGPVRQAGPLRLWWSDFYGRHLLAIQYLLTMMLGLGLPFLAYWWLGTNGWDVSEGVYNVVVAMLALTALSIWAEGFLALKRLDPPLEPAAPYPPASAIIAAYLPNEAPIIEATVAAFLRVQYPGRLQVILAYNTPRDMPEIEQRLEAIAHGNPRFAAMRVPGSTSKAQNVNFALPYATGEFTAVFDADHQPDPDSFRRAWRWLSHGADVVQGHCFIRNGAASWVAKMVAIEFEQIYAVSHPGRARLHGFGIFGGSNGYWRTSLLRELRMHGFMLTEDIDSSMRAVVAGRCIVSDPYLVSRELAPETMQALTKQRLRWAQGWLQISLKWIVPALRSQHLSMRQKLGMLQLLAWREVYPWVSMQIIPLVAWWAVREGSLWRLDWLVPLFVATTLFTLSTGPGQILFTYRLADPALKKHRSWFWFYVATSTLFYAGLKNAWNRIAHYKEWRGETAWIVTPRVAAKR
jgi:cellulose synthase/poly-beta-1,6-N-acetylglucosamine synthase-like glycosyltransferase